MARVFTASEVTENLTKAICAEFPEINAKKLSKMVSKWSAEELERRERLVISEDSNDVIVITDYTDKSCAFFGGLKGCENAFESAKGTKYARRGKLKFGVGFAISNKRFEEVSEKLKEMGKTLKLFTTSEYVD